MIESKKCEFCDNEESIDHLLFSCSLARFLWDVIGAAFGNSKTPKSFLDLCQDWLPSYTGKDRAIYDLYRCCRTFMDCLENKEQILFSKCTS